MEKVKNYILAMAVVAIAVIGGCTKAPVQPTNSRETNSNNIVDNNTTVTVQYTVRVVPRHERGGKVAGLAGAKVIVSQGNGTDRQEVTTNADGHANFNVKLGAIEVYVEAPGYARVNVPANAVRVADYVNSDEKNHVEQGNATTVILPSLNAGIKGRLFFNDPNNDKKPAAGLTVVFELTNKNVQPNQYRVTTGADGSFTFDKVPDGEAGSLRADTTGLTGTGLFATPITYSTGAVAATGTSGDYAELGNLAMNPVGFLFTGSLRGTVLKPNRVVDAMGAPIALATYYTVAATDFGVPAGDIDVVLTYTGLPAGVKSEWVAKTNTTTGVFTFDGVPSTDNAGVTATVKTRYIVKYNVAAATGIPAHEEEFVFGIADQTVGGAGLMAPPAGGVGVTISKFSNVTNPSVPKAGRSLLLSK